MSISRQLEEATQVPKSTRRNGNDDEESPSSPPIIKGGILKKKAVAVRYRECQKNHAASMGGDARDGCGEFMPSGEEGTLEALKCSACTCHRNFHRKETLQGDHYFSSSYACSYHPQPQPHNKLTTTVIYPTATLVSSRMTAPQGRMIMGEEEIGGGGGKPRNKNDEQGVGVGVKKRFRTKFTQEQKEKMLRFAERAGWRIQKQEESVVQQLCQEIGIKRRVLKVWMHNNKHKTKPSTPPPPHQHHH